MRRAGLTGKGGGGECTLAPVSRHRWYYRQLNEWSQPRDDNEADNDKRPVHHPPLNHLVVCCSISPSSRGKDGRGCVLKAICNAAGRSRRDVGKGSFMREILHTVFT